MKICITTSKHVSYNPRVVKEADALSSAGYDVTVVTVNNNMAQSQFDEVLMASRAWKLKTVDYRKSGFRERFRWLYTGARQALFRKLSPFTQRFGVAERAQGREFPELKRLACTVRADLYIAHHVEALGAAFAASRKYGGRLGFDAEDFHSGMFHDGAGFSAEDSTLQGLDFKAQVAALLKRSESLPKGREQERIEYLERKYLPGCDYLSAASEGIGWGYASKYGLPRPTTILNVFPLETLPEPSSTVGPVTPPIKLYWYSQVIGAGRGLDEAVQALSLVKSPCELHLRGSFDQAYIRHLQGIAEKLGVADRVHYHAPCPPESLIEEAARYDVGLALENSVELNRLICLTNKIFTYMNAGLAIIASDTPAQRAIMGQAPAAGAMCHMRDAQSLAEAINSVTRSPESLLAAKRAARKAAVACFHWESEGTKLLALVANVTEEASS